MVCPAQAGGPLEPWGGLCSWPGARWSRPTSITLITENPGEGPQQEPPISLSGRMATGVQALLLLSSCPRVC